MDKKALIVTVTFVAALAAGTIANLVTPNKEFSEAENRYLQQFPAFSLDELFSGRFTSSFEKYTTDQFWNRDGWVGLKTLTQYATLGRDNGRAYFGRDGYLFEKTEEYDPSLVETNCAAVATFVSRAREWIPGLQARVMLVPTAAAIFPEKLPLYAPVPDQKAVIDQMAVAVGADTLVNPWEALTVAKDASPFYRTDHHWTVAGAYAGYTAWAASMHLTPTARDAFEIETLTDEFYGTVYSKANLYTIEPDHMEAWTTPAQASCTISWEGGSLSSLYDPAYLAQKDKYAYFLGGNHPFATVTGSTDNGRVLLLIKDSYANALVPFLTAHYEKILLVDPRYYKTPLTSLLQTENITDLLVLYNVNGFAEEKTVTAVLPGLFPAEK